MSNELTNFDPNRWYSIKNAKFTSHSLVGTYLVMSNNTAGAVFSQIAKPESAEQIWQFFPIEGSFVLRTLAGGQAGFLATKQDSKVAWTGSTVPRLARNTLFEAEEVDGGKGKSSMFWNVASFGDGSFYFYNRQNGSDWHLCLLDNALSVLDSNATGPIGQRFTVVATDREVNDERFSSLPLPGATVSSSFTGPSETASSSFTDPRATVSSDSTDPKGNDNSGKGGLSTGAQVGTGLGVGLVALAACLIGVWLFLKRRKEKISSPQIGDMEYRTGKVHMLADNSYSELQAQTHHVSELPTGPYKITNAPAELPGNTPGWRPRSK